MESARVSHVRLAFCSICYTELACMAVCSCYICFWCCCHPQTIIDTALPRMQLKYHIIKYPTMNVSADVHINDNIIGVQKR